MSIKKIDYFLDENGLNLYNRSGVL